MFGIVLAAAVLAAAVLIISYVCYRMAFHVRREAPREEEPVQIPEGKIYETYRDPMERWAMELRQMEYRELTVRSFDGLTLYAKLYEYAPGAPIELMFHGYRGTAERDLSGGVQRCFALGRSALLVDQRCSGKSGGHVITFGIREHRDCLAWVQRLREEFGPERKLILTGISMGAATVLMAAGKPLPENVVGVLADCGYSSPKEIICKVIRQMGLPVKLAYPFVRLGGRLYGGFDLESYSPLEAMKQATVPVIFVHGEADDFVPCQMSRQVYEACGSKKRLVTVPGAGHGLSYLVDPEGYLQALREFFPPQTFV